MGLTLRRIESMHLLAFLKKHEEDIALERKDFGTLKGLFHETLSRWPESKKGSE